MSIEPDIVESVRADFSAEVVPDVLGRLEAASNMPRIQRCIVFAARGHPWYLEYLCQLAKIDYRDVIMAAEYDRLNIRLYDFTMPIPHARIEDPYATNTPSPDPTKYG
jgi:hypothetical protein